MAWGWRRGVAVALLVGIAAGCGAPPGGAGPGVTPGVPTDGTPSAVPTMAPKATTGPIAGATPTEAPEATPAPLPEAVIVTSTGEVTGDLGSATLDGMGSDSPWLPFDTVPAVTLAAGDVLTIRFADGADIGAWSAGIAAAEDRTGDAVSGVGGRDEGPPAESITVGPLPAGRWVLAVSLSRADGRGSGMTYWAVTVP